MKDRKKKKIITISMDEDVIRQIDEYADSVGISRSSFLAMVAMEKIRNNNKAKED